MTHKNIEQLKWDRGAAEIHSLGCMLGPVTFVLDDGRQVSPFHVAPWVNEDGLERHPAILQNLRGEWPCVPFGAADLGQLTGEWQNDIEPSGEHPHGFGSNTPWTLNKLAGPCVIGEIDYPASHPVKSLRRAISGVKNQASIQLSLEIDMRKDAHLPIGLHPVFRLPESIGAMELIPGTYKEVWTYPGDTGGETLFEKNARSSHLHAVPLQDGQTIEAHRLPFEEPSENLLLLTETDGQILLRNWEEKYQVELVWQKDHFPSLMLWMSNYGRQSEPWNGRHLALGVEPVCSAFDIGEGLSNAKNPLAQAGYKTSLFLLKNQIWKTEYCISVSAL